jgi:DNA-binding CsgD family transcriptional regulator
VIAHLSGVNKLFLAAQYSECLKALEGDESDEAHVLRARTLYRVGRTDDALAELARVRAVDGEIGIITAALKARGFANLDDEARARACLKSARSLPGATAVARAELAVAEAYLAECLCDADGMRSAALSMDPDEAGKRYRILQLAYLSAAILLEGDWVEYVRQREEMVSVMFANRDSLDAFVLANAAQMLANCACELFSEERFAFAADLFERVPWTKELAYARFLTKRSLAWAHALHGDEKTAHRMVFELIDEVPVPQLRPSLYVDQAYLFTVTGTPEIANAWLEKAISFALQVSWETVGEERLGLLALAELAADHDPESSRSLLAIYDRIETKYDSQVVFAFDKCGHRRAMEDHARGASLAATGATDAAIPLLKAAFSTFSRLGFTWRAASVSLRLHALTGDRAWLRKAEDAVVELPSSAIAREVRRRAHGDTDPRLASLSPAQRRVFELICHGKSNKEIASALKIAVNTARNHVAAVLARFGAQSRAQLAAAARESGLLT